MPSFENCHGTIIFKNETGPPTRRIPPKTIVDLAMHRPTFHDLRIQGRCRKQCLERLGLLHDTGIECRGSGPATRELNGFEERIHRDLVAKERELRWWDDHAQLHFVRADESAVDSHQAHVVAQCEHEAGTEGVAVDRADRGYRKGDDPSHELHELVAEDITIAPWVFALGAAPFQVETIGEELLAG